MASYSDIEKRALLSIPIPEVFMALGLDTTHSASGLYYSPFRKESSPSFHIKEDENIWYDFGSGVGGGLLDLVRALRRCSTADALDWLSSIKGNCHIETPTAHTRASTTPKTSGITIVSAVSPFRNQALINYAASREVSREILEKYCKEVYYKPQSHPDKQFYAIGFPNNNGGYVLRSKYAKLCTDNCITTLDALGSLSLSPTTSSALVFEGFFDFLSWLSFSRVESPERDCCILNSITNTASALDWISAHSTIYAFLDNDAGGRQTLEKIAQGVASKHPREGTVYDMSTQYSGYKDVNEKILGK